MRRDFLFIVAWFAWVTMLAFLSFLFSNAVHGSDALHVPLLVKHHQESHFLAGALVGYGMDAYLESTSPHLKPLPRFLIVTGTALALGAIKEYAVDHHARNKEIGPWGLGAACAFTIRFSF